MLLFRSEEHLARWRWEREIPPGETMTVAKQWYLAREWYSNRMDPEWRRRTPEEAQEVFNRVGLEGDFWRLTAPTG